MRNTEALVKLDDYLCGYMYRKLYSEDEELFNIVQQAVEDGATPWEVENLTKKRTEGFEETSLLMAAATFMLRQKLDREQGDTRRTRRRRHPGGSRR